MERRTLIGEILVDEGWVTLQQLRVGLAWQQRWGGKLGRALVGLGYLDECVLMDILSRQLHIQLVEVESRDIPTHVIDLVPLRLLRERRLLPILLLAETRRGPLVVATSDPLNVEALDEVAFASGKEVRPVLAPQWDIDRALLRHLDRGMHHSPAAKAPGKPARVGLAALPTRRN
ncbi:MAG TPA: hypothetical protein VMK42_16260 [Anaeromyxobacteraceae bacterium]|nr:hypothetical protein [Anaeromyxobacteraceae bacterium]